MSSQPSNFRRTEIKRAVQAMQAAARVELHDGKVLIIPADDESKEVADDSTNSFDKIMRKPALSEDNT